MSPHVPFPIRAGLRHVAIAAVLALGGGCVPAAGPTASAPPTGPYAAAINDPQSCGNPANGWTGRFAARANSSGGGGAGAGRSLVACFPDAASCQSWLGHAVGSASGVIVEQSCRPAS